jgi:predicted hotdog family 3-hydroxylacyl-ACP dehydratase
MHELLYDREWIAARIPHRYDMCLLDGVLTADSQQITCIASSHRARDNPLRHRGRLGALCAIEYAAQAMAVHGAVSASVPQQQRPQSGYLTSARNVVLRVAHLDDIEGDLEIQAQRISGDSATVLYNFSVRAGNSVLVEGRAAVVLDTEKLLDVKNLRSDRSA